RLGRRLLRRLDPRRPDRQLRGLPRAETRPRVEHSGHGRRAALAPARPLSRERAMTILSGDPPRGRRLQVLIVLIVLALSLALALAIGLLSLRVQSIFFAMVTLAVAYAFNVLASQLSWLTGGEDGRS